MAHRKISLIGSFGEKGHGLPNLAGPIAPEVIRDLSGGSWSGVTMQPLTVSGKRGLRYKKQRPDVDVTQDYLRSLALLESDRELVRYLGEVEYATTEQVSRMQHYAPLKSPLKSAQKRLTQLWEWHLLDRGPCAWMDGYGILPQLAYWLGKAGNLMLGESDAEGSKWRGMDFMLHNILLGELLIGLMATGRKKGWNFQICGERAAAVQFEYNEQRFEMRPNGLLFMNNEDLEIPLFVELDTPGQELDHFWGKAFQYNAYFASNKWRAPFEWGARLEQFPYVAVVVWGNALDDDANRQSKADARIQRIVAKVKGEGKWTQGYNWLFARLDQAQLGHFSMLTVRSAKLVEFNLFDAG